MSFPRIAITTPGITMSPPRIGNAASGFTNAGICTGFAARSPHKHPPRSPIPSTISPCQSGAIAGPARQINFHRSFIKAFSAIAPGACPLRLHFERALSSDPLAHSSRDCPMKLLTKLVGFLAVLIVLVVAGGYLLPSHVHV
ncbi:MAG: hypothetical protein WBA99_01920 [Nodosilinea sp.]